MPDCCRKAAEATRAACADACAARADAIDVVCDDFDPRRAGFRRSRARSGALREQALALRTLPLPDVGAADDRIVLLEDALHNLMQAAQRIAGWDVERMEHSDDCPASQCPVCGGCEEGHDQVGTQCECPGEQDSEDPKRTHAACDRKRCAVGQVRLLIEELGVARAIGLEVAHRGST